jgi:biopolymer transport protein TolR
MRGLVGRVRHVRQPHIFTALNLTSLIDLFTILVLFLLFNMASGGEVIPSSQKIKLPQSISDTVPKATVTIIVTEDNITVEGVEVGSVSRVMSTEDLVIPDLKKELDRHAEKARKVGEATGTQVFEGKVTILGDRLLPFRLLEKVMFTCSQAEFSDISLAVIQKETAA